MATLLLTKTWVNLLPDGTAVSGQAAPDRNEAHEVDGEVRTYAGGRRRAVTAEGEKTKFPFTLRYVTSADKETLRSWKGRAVLVRDDRGRAFTGVFFGVAVKEYKADPDRYDVTLDFEAVTDPGVA